MPQYPVPGGGGTSATHDYYSNPEKYGEYQFINLGEIIDNFTAAYVGEGKILGTTLKADVTYHAHRALQELHYDTLTSCKSQEIILPPSLTMRLPHDYVNYTKITWSDASGIEHIIYPTSKTSKGNKIQQDEDGNYLFNNLLVHGNLAAFGAPLILLEDNVLHLDNMWGFGPDSFLPDKNTGFIIHYGIKEGYGIIDEEVFPSPAPVFKVGMEIVNKAFPPGTTITEVEHLYDLNAVEGSISAKISTSNKTIDFPSSWNTLANRRLGIIDNTSDTTWGKYKGSSGIQGSIDNTLLGQRFGLDPQFAQANGSFFIDCAKGLIHFSSDLNGKTIILHYLSDGHGGETGAGNTSELIVHKFAEEAMYKWIAYGCASARIDIPEGVIQRLKKERFAETRKAKIRLSNIKIEEITQLMRGKSKFIKH